VRLHPCLAVFHTYLLQGQAGGLLIPVAGITLKPEFAGLAMALSSLTLVMLSLTLNRHKPSVKAAKDTGGKAAKGSGRQTA